MGPPIIGILRGRGGGGACANRELVATSVTTSTIKIARPEVLFVIDLISTTSNLRVQVPF
jgi:hypothetical protein